MFVSGGRLKPLWRVLSFFIFSFLILQFITQILWDETLIRYILLFLILLGLSFLFARLIDKRSLVTIGFMFHSHWLREYFIGLITGFVCVSFLFLFLWSTGSIEVTLTQITLTLLKDIFVLSLLTTLFQSAFEELLFRGYLFQNLILATNTIIATAILSLLFGMGHLLTPHAKWITAVNLSVFGVLHALVYLKTRSLWLPSGLHFGWNFFMRNIYSLPVSGTKAGSCLFAIQENGPTWMTGGNYGPEAGLPALFILLIACFVFAYGRKIRIHPEMRKHWEKNLT